MGAHHAMDLTRRIDEIDRAPVGQGGGGEAGHATERDLEIKR